MIETPEDNERNIKAGDAAGPVFISYASQDAAVAKALCTALEHEGVTCWIAPRDVRPGASYAAAIVRAINDCRVLLLLLSKSAIDSPHVLREVERASSKRRPVLSVRLDGTELTPELEYFLSAHQWMDAGEGSIEQIMPALIESVRARASNSAPTDLHNSAAASLASSASDAAPQPSESEHGLPSTFLGQLRRRHVGRVAILYIGVCYLILEPFSTFLHVLALPEWTGRVLVALMVLAFPAALIFAWAFEPTHDGNLAPNADVGPRSARLTGRRLDIAIIIVLAVALSYFALDKFWLSKQQQIAAGTSGSDSIRSPAAVLSDKSIAVLPFVDLSEKHDQEYFADGMAEAVLDLLANIPGLKVIGRTSTFQFKGKNQDLRLVGSTLGARYVAEGSVRKSGDQVRVTAQLINAEDGSHLWSDTFNEPVGDALKMQDKIAANLARALQVTVGADYQQARPSFRTAEQYELYLRGRHAIDRSDKEGLESAVTYFQQILDLDPNSAPAAAWLSAAQEEQAELGFVEPREGMQRARASAQRALRLDPNSREAHIILGLVQYVYDWDWLAAERSLGEAMRLAPRDPIVIANLGQLYAALGRWDDSARYLETALTRDPLFAIAHATLGGVRVATGQLDEAEAEARRTLQISPTYGEGRYNLGTALLLQGKLDAALSEMRQETSPGARNVGLAIVYHAMRRRGESDAALSRAVQEHAEDDASEIADAYAYRGEKDLAFKWLERAYDQKDTGLWEIKGDPFLKEVKKDPRYIALLRKMNFPD